MAALSSSSLLPSQEAGPPYHLLVSCPTGLSRSQLCVEFSSVYDRVPHPDAALEEDIEQIWKARVEMNSSLYNATKFRYGGYHILASGEDKGNPSSVCLHLGLTDYKAFVGTNMCCKWEQFLTPSIDVDMYKHTASPLGNGAVVETLDHCILVLQRSHNVAEYPGHLVFPGGHSEPREIGISGHINVGSAMEMDQLNAKITKEMFDGITREVVEETGVPNYYLSDPLFIGVSRRVVNARPTAFFYLKCSISSAEVLNFYAHAEHGFESTGLLRFPKENLKCVSGRMPGCHQGGAALFDLMSSIE
eukprot:c21103_g1_i2 orf=315-1226(-)